jgi:hypothetical protein
MHTTNIVELASFIILWVVIIEFVHVLLASSPNKQLLLWAVGPYGITAVSERSSSQMIVVIDGILPSIVSGCFLYVCFFTRLSDPFTIPHTLIVEVVTIGGGLLLSSSHDFLIMLQDLRMPLEGELRILRALQRLQEKHYVLHFTSFGTAYMHQYFDIVPQELTQVLG